MIKVCDAIMGTGKTNAAITYMNEHPERKFIYITPYLDEAHRIVENCPGLRFIEPNNRIERYNFKKTLHAEALLREGRNISTTHSAFKRYTPDMLKLIKENEYTLIIDENVDVLDKLEASPYDLELVVNAGYMKENNGVYTLTDKEYKGKALSDDLLDVAKSRSLIRIGDEIYYWILPKDLITSFKDVIILTYLFKGQSLHSFLEIYKLDYETIGVEYNNGRYAFCSNSRTSGYTPAYVNTLRSRIHLLDDPRMNSVGDNYHALSINWFNKEQDGVRQLQKNIYNCFNNIWRKCSASKKMWGTYKSSANKLKGKGYTKAHLMFNTKATNKYRDRDCLVYATNIFMNVNEKKLYYHYGIEVDEDAYALSIMVQWIWRSAIRDGRDIYIYLPSRRMRELLINWIDSVSEEVTCIA